MMQAVIFTTIAQYGREAYGSSIYGDVTEHGSRLANTGQMILPGIIFGVLCIIVSVWIVRSRRRRGQDRTNT